MSTHPALNIQALPDWASKGNIADKLSEIRSSAPYVYYPVNPEDYAVEYQCTTWDTFTNIVNGFAAWIQKQFGPGQEGSVSTLAYLGSHDVRDNAMILAAHKVGYNLLLLPARNSPATHASFLDTSGAEALLVSDPSVPGLSSLATACQLSLVRIPSLDDLYNLTNTDLANSEGLTGAKDEPLVLLHTSGNSGRPELSLWTHSGAVSSLTNTFNSVAGPDGLQRFGQLTTSSEPESPLTDSNMESQDTIPTEIVKQQELLDILIQRLKCMPHAGSQDAKVRTDLNTAKTSFAGYGAHGTALLPTPISPTSADWKNVQFPTTDLKSIVDSEPELEEPTLDPTQADDIEAVLKRHIRFVDNLRLRKISAPQTVSGGVRVLLTGTTGFIGSYVLEKLIQNPDVQHITCLNRSTDSAEIQNERFTNRGSLLTVKSDRVSFLKGALPDQDFGLENSTYLDLLNHTTHIIHGAWPVDFMMTLSSYDPLLTGVDKLLEFVTDARNKISLSFVSSIAAVLAIPDDSIKETLHSDSSSPGPGGYGTSKYVAEQVLDYAAEQLNIDVRIVRPGQVAPPVHNKGVWNLREWFPCMIRSSVAIGAIPSVLPGTHMDWVPIDFLSQVLVELAMADDGDRSDKAAEVFQPVNANITQWAEVRGAISKFLERRSVSGMKMVSLQEWVQLVREYAGREPDASERNPAAALIGWFDAVAGANISKVFENSKAMKSSQTLRGLGPVTAEMMLKWIGDIAQ